MKIEPHDDYPHGYLKGVGPCAPPSSRCEVCGCAGFIMECQTCRARLCYSHWWKHSHQDKTTNSG